MTPFLYNVPTMLSFQRVDSNEGRLDSANDDSVNCATTTALDLRDFKYNHNFVVRRWRLCDQMAKLCFQYLAIFSNENVPNSIKLCQSELKTLPKPKKTLKILPKIFNYLPTLCNFAKSGHTGWRRLLYYIYELGSKFRVSWSNECNITSVTRLGDLLDFRQLFKAFGNNQFTQISNIPRQFLYRCQKLSFF